MTLSCKEVKKPKPPVSVKLPDELEAYLRAQAKEGFRSLSKEIMMRLEWSRRADGGQQHAQN